MGFVGVILMFYVSACLFAWMVPFVRDDLLGNLYILVFGLVASVRFLGLWFVVCLHVVLVMFVVVFFGCWVFDGVYFIVYKRDVVFYRYCWFVLWWFVLDSVCLLLVSCRCVGLALCCRVLILL